MMYFVGLVVIAMATGTRFTQFEGWLVFGAGLMVAGIYNELFAKESK